MTNAAEQYLNISGEHLAKRLQWLLVLYLEGLPSRGWHLMSLVMSLYKAQV